MPKATKAQRSAAFTLQGSYQPRSRLNPELMKAVLLAYLQDSRAIQKTPEQPPSKFWRDILPLLSICRLWNRLLIPELYGNVHIRDNESYFSFLSTTHLESFRHIKTVSLHLSLAKNVSIKEEESKFKALLKRVQAYEKVLSKGEKGKDRPRFEFWPTRVEFSIYSYPVEGRRNAWCHNNVVCKLPYLFPKSIVRIKISDFDFLATTLDPTTTFSPLHPCHPIAQVDLPHDSAAILMFPTDPERPGLFPLKRCFRHIIHRIGSKDLLENGVVPSDERMVYLAYRQAVDIAKRCEYAIERVELKLKVEEDTEEQRPFGEHAFCCATTTEREKKWDPKIVIPCCDFDCRKPKTLFENFLSRFLRSDGPMEVLLVTIQKQVREETGILGSYTGEL